MTELVVMLDKQIIKRLAVKGTSVTIGRHSKSDITLPDRTISTQHARITIVREDCFLEDLQSTNGTYVNYQLIDRHLLADGDAIGLGKYQIIFRTKDALESQLKRLSIHPKLMEDQYQAWLRVIDGRKAGYIVPLDTKRLVLGNNEQGKVIIERDAQGSYIMQELGTGHSARTSRVLIAGDELQVEDVSFQFCLSDSNAEHTYH